MKKFDYVQMASIQKKKKTDTPNPKTAAIKEILHVSLKSLHV